jgi:hypothetical protein
MLVKRIQIRAKNRLKSKVIAKKPLKVARILAMCTSKRHKNRQIILKVKNSQIFYCVEENNFL